MTSDFDTSKHQETLRRVLRAGGLGATTLFGIAGLCGIAVWIFLYCRIEVPTRKIAVLTKKTGAEITNSTEIVAIKDSGKFKGIEEKVLTEGRYFYEQC
jgi:hypothetical protein